jgi:hypothetical protein
MAVAGEQPDTIAVPLDDQAEPIVLHLVEPLTASRNLGASGRDAGLEFGYWHAGDVSLARPRVESASMPKRNLRSGGLARSDQAQRKR